MRLKCVKAPIYLLKVGLTLNSISYTVYIAHKREKEILPRYIFAMLTNVSHLITKISFCLSERTESRTNTETTVLIVRTHNTFVRSHSRTFSVCVYVFHRILFVFFNFFVLERKFMDIRFFVDIHIINKWIKYWIMESKRNSCLLWIRKNDRIQWNIYIYESAECVWEFMWPNRLQ